MIKKILMGSLAVVLVVGLSFFDTISYMLGQAWGQVKVMTHAQKIEKAQLTSEQRKAIQLVEEIKKFSVDSLGLYPSKSYRKIYQQNGKPLLWVMYASEKYQLKAKEYHFPILGTFSYIGYFDKAKLDKAQKKLEAENYETRVSEVSAYSTLGFLNDPILSKNLELSEPQICELFFHELTHGTIFTRKDLSFNENLADFVSEEATLWFLKSKYGAGSEQVTDYLALKEYNGRFSDHIKSGAHKLDSLYRSFTPASPKDSLKTAMIGEIVSSLDTLAGSEKFRRRRFNKMPNNAFFIGFLTYQKMQNQFEEEFKTKFASDLKLYISFLKNKYPSITWRSWFK